MLWRVLTISFGLMLSGCPAERDCTERSDEMAIWMNECVRGHYLTSCREAAKEIFCKPITETK